MLRTLLWVSVAPAGVHSFLPHYSPGSSSRLAYPDSSVHNEVAPRSVRPAVVLCAKKKGPAASFDLDALEALESQLYNEPVAEKAEKGGEAEEEDEAGEKKAKKKKKDKAGNKEASGAKETSVGKDEAAGATKEAEEKGAAVEKQKQEEATEKHQVSKVLSSVEVPDALADVRPPEPGSPEGMARRKRGATGRKADRREEAPGVEEKGAGKVKGVANGEAKEKGVGMASSDSSFAVGSAGSGLASGLASGKDKDSSGDLVSYLQATGSILALAEMLDEEEDDCGVSDEDMRLLQEAALKRREDSKPSQAASSAAKGNLPKGNGSKGNGSKGGNSKGNPRGQKK
mmetsp:Transcript_70149/g.158625  ORF Transcript_70149/g.158625 Transcript_70149/m.158625 type:complete len:343 (+) Transcript_70149:121-1149(+)